MKKILLIITTFMLSFQISPEDGATLNYTHVLFEWEQIKGTEYAYQFQLSLDENFTTTLVDIATESLIHIEKPSIDWDTTYYWRVRTITSNNGGPYSDWSTRSFTTSNQLSSATTSITDQNQYAEGFTLFSSFFDYYSAILDIDGNEIWNSGDSNNVYYNNDGYGNFFGSKSLEGVEYNLPGLQFSIDSETIWMEPNESFLHHDFFKLPNGNYMGLIEHREPGPIPEDIPFDVLSVFLSSFFPTYPSCGWDCFVFPWAGDKIVEWDIDGNIIWEWNIFEHLDWLEDYDLIGGSWNIFTLNDGKYDWTHCNALTFHNNKLYLSSRNLSRIIKVDYPSGEIDWQIGLDMPSGDVGCGIDLNFSFQHSIQILDNGNIVIFDNGILSEILNDVSYPTSRALEIEVIESENGCEANIVWEYSLPENLFGNISGNAQKLNNGNYLITTVGDGGTSIEVNPNGEIVWQANYNLSLPQGLVYRAHRIESLHPIAFSVVSDSLALHNMYDHHIYAIPDDATNISFEVWNNGDITETFDYTIENQSGSFEINPGESRNITFDGAIGEHIDLNVSPMHRKDLEKNITMDLVLIDGLIGNINQSSDGVIDVTDIIMIVSYIVGNSDLNFVQLQLANINNDNYVDLLDIIQIVEIILD